MFSHPCSHCNACKLLGGGGYSLNNVTAKENFKITKGELKTYTYYGDSGTEHVYPAFSSLSPTSLFVDASTTIVNLN